jgi:hypothetical protein
VAPSPIRTPSDLRMVGSPPIRSYGNFRLTAVSQDEAWAADGDEWFRYRGNSWEAAEFRVGYNCSVVPAFDGAAWVVTDKGLVRMAGEQTQVIDADLRDNACSSIDLHAVGDGSVVVSASSMNNYADLSRSDLARSGVVRYGPDGERETIGKPDWMRYAAVMAAGAEGSVWVNSIWCDWDEPGDECSDGEPTALWNGARWRRNEYPSTQPPGWSHPCAAISDDGTLWREMPLDPPQSDGLAKLVEGKWSHVADYGGSGPQAVPDARACVTRWSDCSSSECYPVEIECHDTTGHASSRDLTGTGISSISIAPDGAVWVEVGEQGFGRLTDGVEQE